MSEADAFSWLALGPWDWTFLALSAAMVLWGGWRLLLGDATPSPHLDPLPEAPLPAWAQAAAMLTLFATVFGVFAMGGPVILGPVVSLVLGLFVADPGATIGGFQGSSLAGGFLGQMAASALLIGLGRLEPSLLHAQADASDRETLRADGPGLRRLLGLFAAALALTTAGSLIWTAFEHMAASQGTVLPDENQLMVDALLGHQGPAWPVVATALYVVVGAPLVEELGFRGMIYPAFRRVMPRGWAVAMVGILFGIIHGNLATLLPISLLGAWLCLVRDRFGLGACVALHAMSNAWSLAWLLRAPDVARHL